jgi:hypothetical protein
MIEPPQRAAIYSNGATPLFLDTAQITFAFADGPPVTSLVEVARVDYERNAATIVFCDSDHEAIDVLALSPYFHTKVSLTRLREPERAEEANPDFEISHAMQVTLHFLSGDSRPFDPYSQLEGLVANALKERRRMLRAGAAINEFGRHTDPSCAELAREARNKALSRLARLSDAQTLSLLEGNRLSGPSGLLPPVITIGEVRSRRNHLQAIAHMMRRLQVRKANLPFMKSRRSGQHARLQR